MRFTKIGEASPLLSGAFKTGDGFGMSVANIGDLDGDGITELAVGCPGVDNGGQDRGAVWILFLDRRGALKGAEKISSTSGEFAGQLDNEDWFGISVAGVGDLNRDGVPDLAVGAYGDDDGGMNKGAVWILHLRPNGRLLEHHKISSLEGGFGAGLKAWDFFGGSVSGEVDLDGSGVKDLVVGALGGRAAWILFLNEAGTVVRKTKISNGTGGFEGELDYADSFGTAVSFLGDVNSDGVADAIVGADLDDDGGAGGALGLGAVWVLFLDAAVWTDLGMGMPGTVGVPLLDGMGSLVGSEPVTIRLRDAAPLAPAWLIAGASQLSQPFKGGTLVPSPDWILQGTVTDSDGRVIAEDRWPPGVPSKAATYFQWWVLDAQGAFGFSASNALSAVTP